MATIDLLEQDLDGLPQRSREILTDVVGPDREFAVTPVDQHRQLHDPGAAKVGERVERRTDRTAGKEHVIDQHDHPVIDAAARHFGGLERAHSAQPQIVAVHGRVERADGDVDALELGDPRREALGER